MCIENRKNPRFRAKTALSASVQADGLGLTSKGIVLNISLSGAYILAPSIPFQTAMVRFDLSSARSILKKCSRIDPHQKGAKGMALEFSTPLTAQELESLMDPSQLHVQL